MLRLLHPDILTAMGQLLIDAMDAGSGPGVIKVYKAGATGGVPQSMDEVLDDQVLVGTLTLSSPAATVEEGLVTFDAIAQEDGALEAAEDEDLFVILEDSDGTRVLIGDVSNNAGTGLLKLNTTIIAVGGPIQISSLVIRVGRHEVA